MVKPQKRFLKSFFSFFLSAKYLYIKLQNHETHIESRIEEKKQRKALVGLKSRNTFAAESWQSGRLRQS